MTRTRQEIFNLAWNGLKAQGFEQSMGEANEMCRYRGDEGRKCAIGHCIPDARYKRSWEGTVLTDSIDIRRAAGVKKADADFAGDLQSIHDQRWRPQDMEEHLRVFAAAHSLTIPA